MSAGTHKAKATLAATQAALEDTRLQLGLRVLQAYGDWWGPTDALGHAYFYNGALSGYIDSAVIPVDLQSL